ncbi:aminotransferase class V-fold PLP-dependent enzyme [Henriciella sp. AS95]|uniref:aminotransferase class V-fold PLP-dependent enzyme n=1 Tax=Henriciella sp. AS95 TaxID=3135782 RepID=UPI003178B5FD
MSDDIPASRAEAAACDASDPLRQKRDAFDLEAGLIYLDGHSLGPASHSSLEAVNVAGHQEWRRGLIRSWNDAGWFALARDTGRRLARLIGVDANEVIVADSVSLNLHKLAAAARALAQSPMLIVEEDEFPTDQYMIEALAELAGADFVRAAPGAGLDTLSRTGGILIKSVVSYRSAAVTDIKAAEQRAREADGVIIWDLSHATGIIDLDLKAAGARFAAGCTYKYLNGGPGAPAFLYVDQDIVQSVSSPLPGWMGHARPFAFEPAYAPAPDIRRFAAGTPPILSLRAMAGALDVFDDVDMAQSELKARRLGDLVLSRTRAMSLKTISPGSGKRRGGHVSVLHEHGYAIVQALIARGIIADFRAPDTIRFGVAPLYLSFTDIWDAMDALEDILSSRSYTAPEFNQRAAVT